MSEAVFEGMRDEDRAILLEEFRKGGNDLADLSANLEAEIRAEFEAEGVTFHEADIDAYREKTASFYSSFPEWPDNLHDEVRAAAKAE